MNDVIEIPRIDTKSADEYRSKAADVTTQVTRLKIINQEQYEIGASLRKTMKAMLSELDTKRKEITKPLDTAKKAVMDLFRPAETSLDNGIRHVDSLLVDYNEKKERERQIQEEKLRKEAEAKEAKLRAEKERQEAEWRAKEAAARKELEKQNALIAKAKNEKARAEAEAAAAKARTEQERANRLAEERRQQAADVQVVAPILASPIAKVKGLSYRENWSAEVNDLRLLIKAVAEGKAPLNFLRADMTVLNSQAISTKDSMIVPGVKFIMTKTPVGR